MSKTKELVICTIAIIALILSITTNVFATSIDELLGNMNSQNYQTIPDSNTGTNVANLATIDSNNTNTSNIASNNTLATIVSDNSANNNTNTIPYTGANSFSVIAIIAVCGVVAVYAYKKIRDYKI